MKHKLITTLLMSSSLLFSSSIVGAWTMDKEEAEKAIQGSANEMEKFFTGAILKMMEDIEFQSNGTCKMTEKILSKCWDKSNENYIIYDEDSNKFGDIELIDDNHIGMTINNEKMPKKITVSFSRIDVSTKTAPKVMMKKEKVYRAKETKGDDFLFFINKDKYVHLDTDGTNSFSTKDAFDLMNGKKTAKRGYEILNSNYKIKNNQFYTLFGDEKIEVVSPKHIKFKGYDYYLEE